MPYWAYRLEELVVKLTVSLSQHARQRIDARAAALGLTRSAFVESLVAAEAERETEQLLEEGYREMAATNLEFADAALPLAWEMVERGDPTW